MFATTAPSVTSSPVAYRAAISELLPLIASNANRTEQGRQVAEENVAALRQAGFFLAFQPRRFGGIEIGADEYGPAVVELAGACASTAWATGLLAQHAHMIALMSDELQHEIWDEDRHALVSSSVAPLGKAEPVAGGIRLSGRFGWSSGCDHATWAILGFRRPDPLLDGNVTTHYAVVPRSDYVIHDDWHVAGLNGTGSKTLIVDDIFVPEHRIDSGYALSSGQSKGFGSNDGDIFHSHFAHWFAMGFSAVSIGIARRFMELYAEKASTRVRAYTGANVGDTAPAYMRLAESHHQVSAAYASLFSDWSAFTARARSRVLPTPAEDVYWRSNQSYTTKLAIEAVDRLFTASGGSAWFQHNEMQRLYRDAKMTGAHTYSDYDIAAQSLGRSLLGLRRDTATF
jgi:alkylation response protein AidB-like acyl-CoA dehydrogenase